MEIAAASGREFVVGQDSIVEVAGIGGHSDANLAKVADAIDFSGFVFGLGDAW